MTLRSVCLKVFDISHLINVKVWVYAPKDLKQNFHKQKLKQLLEKTTGNSRCICLEKKEKKREKVDREMDGRPVCLSGRVEVVGGLWIAPSQEDWNQAGLLVVLRPPGIPLTDHPGSKTTKIAEKYSDHDITSANRRFVCFLVVCGADLHVCSETSLFEPAYICVCVCLRSPTHASV